jgi:hypothetical protein
MKTNINRYEPIQQPKPLQSETLVHRRSLGLRSSFLIVLVLAWVGRAPSAQAVTPAPDGGYANENTAEGQDALFTLSTGSSNTAIGFEALYANTTGGGNTANGSYAMYNNTAGGANTANGSKALLSNTTGNDNTANGYQALALNTGGFFNTANGVDALFSNTIGNSNTASGVEALFLNTAGNENTASGLYALYSNTTGSYNVANGSSALGLNATGNNNTANGLYSLLFNTTGSNNTADGQNALRSNTTGGSNTALGTNAGYNLTTGSNNIDIGNKGVAAESGKIRIGTKGTQTNTYIAGIRGVTVSGGVGVVVDINGQLGTTTSSARYKENIQPMDQASESILSLRPVTFRYKHELDPEGIPQFGLVAEQVEKVNPALVAHDDQGKPYTVRYDAVNAMLLNEFLKEHRKVEELEVLVRRLDSLSKEQAAQIQKVRERMEASNRAPTLVSNEQPDKASN